MSHRIDHAALVRQLADLGVKPGGVLVVHTAFSRVQPVVGGPAGLIEALHAVLGEAGTLVMPSMSDDDDRPFAATTTPCAGMGIVADTFWRQPGVLRSGNAHAFAARGPAAAAITRSHPYDVPHGPDSPIGRVFERDGQVLLLGVGHDANTSIHLAENLAGVTYGQSKYLTLENDGQWQRVDYREIDHCCARFAQLDDWLDAAGRQRRGPVGQAQARLMQARDVVATALAQLRSDPAVFLHAPGLCEECDAARVFC